MQQYFHDEMVIEIMNESMYTPGSADNNFNYSKIYTTSDEEDDVKARLGVKLYNKDSLIDSCIILSIGWETKIHKNIALVNDNKLVVCCGNEVFCLSVHQLKLEWCTKADESSCFQIFQQEEDYIVHGEMAITKLDKQGNIKWEFSGADIFVSIDNEEAFEIESSGIILTDFSKTKYKIDFEGNLLWSANKRSGRLPTMKKKENLREPFPGASTGSEDISHVGITAFISIIIYGIVKGFKKVFANKK
jgi:hypothetical protein